MELKDFVVTPIVLFVIYVLAYIVRPRVTDDTTRRYFIPALTVKIIGAIAVGLLYQFYYGGGDTFAYFTHGSTHIWQAFLEAPVKALRLIMADGDYEASTYTYASKIWFYKDQPSYFVVRIAALLSLFTFNTYSAVACLFAVIGFTGVWALYHMFYQQEKGLHFLLAIAILFMPSVFLWGSGLMKDTITLAALGWLTYAFWHLFFIKKRVLLNVLILLLSFYVIYEVKLYILLVLVPSFIIWLFFSRFSKVKSLLLRGLILPFVVAIVLGFSYLTVLKIGEENRRYSLENLTKTARITAYDIGFYTGRSAGSGYSLGEFSTPMDMVKLFPAAVNVTLFRPYLWEVNSLMMLFATLESFLIMGVFLFVVVSTRFRGVSHIFKDPLVLFCLTFSVVFAFAIGISTYNFGTLTRYKIPLIPFFMSALFLIYYRSKRERKLSSLEVTE